MRALLFILIVAVIAAVAAVATGFVNISQIGRTHAPNASSSRDGVAAQAVQPPAFEVETGSVKVGTKETKVKVPELVVQTPVANEVGATDNAL